MNEKTLDKRSRTVLFSISSNALLLVVKLLTGIFTGSVSVLSEAVHSATDLVGLGRDLRGRPALGFTPGRVAQLRSWAFREPGRYLRGYDTPGDRGDGPLGGREPLRQLLAPQGGP